MSIVSLAPKIVAGSSFAGFGLSLGRDVYKETKKNIGLIILFFLVLFLIIGQYSSSVWLFRNYRTLAGTIFKKFFALIAFMFFYIIITNILLIIEGTPEIINALETGLFDPVLVHLFSSLGTSSFLGISFLLQNLLILVGFFVGYFQRKKRRLAWEAEKHNIAFFISNGLELLDEKNVRDADGNRYRLKNMFANEIEFIAEGRRNKRGYIKYDKTGKYIDWSGMVSIA